MTWAEVAAKKQPRKKPTLAPRVPVPDAAMAEIVEKDRRTLVLRKLPPTTTEASILEDLQPQCQRPLGEVLEAVVREPLDRRRFYLRFRSVEMKRQSAQQGFQIGTITIPPQLADTEGTIPNVPHYLDRTEIVQILSAYGDVIEGDFERYQETGIRCGKFSFAINLHENKKLPPALQILNDTMIIHQKDDLQQCSYCDKYGHLARFCKKKQEDFVRKANRELEMQMAGNNYSEGQAMDVADDPPPDVEPNPAAVEPAPAAAHTPATNQQQQQEPSTASASTSTSFIPSQVLKNKPQVSNANQPSMPVQEQLSNQGVSSVPFVQGGFLQVDEVAPGFTPPYKTPEEPNGTQPLQYPPAFEEDPVNETSSEDDQQNQVYAYHLPPVTYTEHPTNPYEQPRLKLKMEEREPLTFDEYSRFQTLEEEKDSLQGDKLNEYHNMRIRYNSHFDFVTKGLVPIFKRVALERWDLHYNEAKNDHIKGTGQQTLHLPDIKAIYLEATRRVRADLEQTDIFQRHWRFVALHSGLFRKHTVSKDRLHTFR